MYACDMATTEQRIAENIIHLLEDKDSPIKSLNALHEATGISYNTLKRRVVDGRGLQVHELESISKVFNVNPEDLMQKDAPQGKAQDA